MRQTGLVGTVGGRWALRHVSSKTSLWTGRQKCRHAAVPKFRHYCRTRDDFADSDLIHNFGFPYSEGFCRQQFGCNSEKVVQLLEPLIGEDRCKKISNVVSNRIFNIVPAVEGLYDLGNVAAVSRTVEGLGLGSLSVISSADTKFKHSARTSSGSHKWLHTCRWQGTRECLEAAKDDGYNIVVTDLQAAVRLEEVDWTQKTLVLFGNEHAGISSDARELSDQRVMIPMSGFVESFNISVAAAMVLKVACGAVRNGLDAPGDLSEEQQKVLQAVYYAKHIGSNSEAIVRNLLEREKRAEVAIE
eukprot:CAMPEP_0198241368 /NCGR_PEP_ID=MMETSP1446-20131203/6203_1 /TAXON_ID=1461542 ORGANISM="Unidentified sp, Strain CCMP2111" /NCGR_SAMPLE_ID=MMETSP1446 /ASSEMBLY_ACC=CAM_ASM_001112 /LENGTH=301 /DNA_ID=CAMNT_0043924201 /DNA_START=308 /DNA_END=1213 /DNA_ORIENTATION=-